MILNLLEKVYTMGGLNNNTNKNVSEISNFKRKSLLENNGMYYVSKKIGTEINQSKKAVEDMYSEYKLMKSHKWKNLDDYYHCKANYNAAKRGKSGELTAVAAGNYKEAFDYFKNRVRGNSYQEAIDDYWHDLSINKEGRSRAGRNSSLSAQEACADYCEKNKNLPRKYW